MERFPGLMPPLYNKMKILGHIPLSVFCLLHDHAGGALPDAVLAETETYRDAITGAAADLDTSAEAEAVILPCPSQIYPKVTAFLDAIIAKRAMSGEAAALAHSVAANLEAVVAAAAHAQREACNRIDVRQDLLTKGQWDKLQVLVLGPYMAKQGEIFLQYSAQLLNTPAEYDKRIVDFEGDDLQAAIDRLGTTMLDAIGSQAIFGERERLHRDVLADATTQYPKAFAER